MNNTASTDWLMRLLDHDHFIPVAGMVVGIVAIIAAATVTVLLAKLWLTHRQRMSMIARGMHPDGPYIEEIVDDLPPADGAS